MNGTPSTMVSPGLWGFLAFFLLAVALYLLMRNMNARMRRMSYRSQELARQAREQEAARRAERAQPARGDGPAGDAADTGPAATGEADGPATASGGAAPGEPSDGPAGRQADRRDGQAGEPAP